MMTTCSFGLGNGLKLYRFWADLAVQVGLKHRYDYCKNLHQFGYKPYYMYLQLSCVCTSKWNGLLGPTFTCVRFFKGSVTCLYCVLF